LWSLNGQTKDAFTKTQAGGWKYDIIYPGFKMNLPDVCAAIGLAQIKKYNDQLLQERKRVFDFYSESFAKTNWAWLPDFAGKASYPSYHLYPLRIKNISEDQRDAIIQKTAATGISVNVHFIPLPMLSVFKNMGYNINQYPNSYKNYAAEISLPIYPQLSEKQCKYIVEHVTNSVNETIAK